MVGVLLISFVLSTVVLQAKNANIERCVIVSAFIYENALILVGDDRTAYIFNIKTADPVLKIREPEDKGRGVFIETERAASGRLLRRYVFLPTQSLYLSWRRAILSAQLCSNENCARRLILLLVREQTPTWRQIKFFFSHGRNTACRFLLNPFLCFFSVCFREMLFSQS